MVKAGSKKVDVEDPTNKQELDVQSIKNAIWTTTSFGFTPAKSLQYINSGLLGYILDKEGKPKMKNGEKIPITISVRSYFRYKKQFEEAPEVYNDLRRIAIEGYAEIVRGFQEELVALHRFSAENMLALESPLERQQIIDSMIKNVIPTQMAFADMLKKLVTAKKIEEPKRAELIVHPT